MSVQALHKGAPLSVDSARRDAAHFINGEFTQGSTGKSWENRSPIDNSLIGRVPEGGLAEVDAAVKAAHAALHGPWGKLTLAAPRFANYHARFCLVPQSIFLPEYVLRARSMHSSIAAR